MTGIYLSTGASPDPGIDPMALPSDLVGGSSRSATSDPKTFTASHLIPGRSRGSRPPVQVILQVAKPVAPAPDVQHVAQVQQPVEDRRRDHLVAGQHLRPVLDRLVRRDAQ